MTHTKRQSLRLPLKRLCMAGACNLRKSGPAKVGSTPHVEASSAIALQLRRDLDWSKMGSPPENVVSNFY